MKNFFKKYSHCWVLSYGIIYFLWFTHLESLNQRDFYMIRCSLDNYIPFQAAFIVPYLLWFLYVAAAIVFPFFTSRTDYYRTTAYLFIGMTICLIIFSVYPSKFDRGSIGEVTGLFAPFVAKLRSIDTPTNVFPSIHVFNSIVVHVTLMKNTYLNQQRQKSAKKKNIIRTIRILSFLLMISICLSTVFLKQHSALDGFAGALLALILYPFIYCFPKKQTN